jgi:cardiolipin synthase
VNLRDLPNIISVLRIVLVVPIVVLLLEREFDWALLVFFIAGVSDGLDGYLAKRNDWITRLGSILDPLADKALLMSSFIVLAWLELIPLWLVVIVICRDLIIVAGSVAYHYLIGEFDMKPSFMSKLNTFFQIILVLIVVFSMGIMELPDWLKYMFIYSILITTLLSGLNYIWVFSRRALSTSH